jgi:hypothetical protein
MVSFSLVTTLAIVLFLPAMYRVWVDYVAEFPKIKREYDDAILTLESPTCADEGQRRLNMAYCDSRQRISAGGTRMQAFAKALYRQDMLCNEFGQCKIKGKNVTDVFGALLWNGCILVFVLFLLTMVVYWVCMNISRFSGHAGLPMTKQQRYDSSRTMVIEPASATISPVRRRDVHEVHEVGF